MPVINAYQAGGAALLPFLDLIAWSEGTSTCPATKNNGYDVIVTGSDGKPEIFQDFSDHPFAAGRPSKVIRTTPKLETSSASGRYQLMLKWWRAYKPMLDLSDFSPLSQDLVALKQIRERHADRIILAGDIPGAISACSNIWASFPGNDYHQKQNSTEILVQKYLDFSR